MSARGRPDLQGNLAVVPPELVLQILSLARAQGHLVLQGQGERGHVALRAGKVVDAWVGSRQPSGAPVDPAVLRQRFVRFLGWRSGSFQFRSLGELAAGGASFDVEELLLDAMTRLDRARGGAVEDPGH